jgi:UDP-3-O-[3-hydroxymyristoyl] glucosamine N-acyltransferase
MRRFRPPWRALQGATVHATARIHPSAMLLPGAVVAARAYVGAGCVLGPNAAVGSGVTVGAGTSIGPNASLQHCTIGARCTLHAGVNIGADGFGFIPGQPAAAGASAAHVVGPAGDGAAAASADRLGAVMPGDVPPVKKAQLRRVLIGDDVEIGAGSCIDRGSWRDTVVGHHSKLDNLVQVWIRRRGDSTARIRI